MCFLLLEWMKNVVLLFQDHICERINSADELENNTFPFDWRERKDSLFV